MAQISFIIIYFFLAFSEKQAASVFWNGELEIEHRGTNELSFYGLYHKNDDREAVMEEIERRRAQTVYQHSSADCSDDCKKRGACPWLFTIV